MFHPLMRHPRLTQRAGFSSDDSSRRTPLPATDGDISEGRERAGVSEYDIMQCDACGADFRVGDNGDAAAADGTLWCDYCWEGHEPAPQHSPAPQLCDHCGVHGDDLDDLLTVLYMKSTLNLALNTVASAATSSGSEGGSA